MVQRRNLQDAYDEYSNFDEDMIGGSYNPGGAPAGTSIVDLFGGGDDTQTPPMGGDPLADIIDRGPGEMPIEPGAPEPKSGSEGNTERGREFSPGGGMPTTPGAYSGLPQGVSVEERTETPESFFHEDTPPMSMAPDPITAREQTPMPAQTSTGPTRRALSNAAPALFQETGGARMFGNVGGLMGGGRGAVGTNEGGPTPTEMMLSILRQMRGGV